MRTPPQLCKPAVRLRLLIISGRGVRSMKTWPARSTGALSVLLFLLLSASCRRTPDGRQVFLQSEAALDAVRSLCMHIENKGARDWADAEFACDQDIMRYVTVQGIPNAPSLKTERIQ